MATEQEGHTPGPWFVAAQNDGLVIIDGPPSPAPYDGPIPKAHGPDVVATPNWRLAGHEANARLIAAAPDLLEAGDGARQALWNALDHLGFECPDAHPAIVELDAAIARATGEA